MTQNKFSSTERATFYEQTIEPWVERNGFAHGAMALVWFVIAFVLFQLVGGITSAVILLPELMEVIRQGGDVQAVFTENLSKVFIGNTTGQFLIIGLASYFMAKLHTSPENHLQFLRLQTSDNVWKVTVITVVLVFVFMPLNGFLGWLNYIVFDSLVQTFPSLSWFIEMQNSMTETIKGFIGTENAVFLAFLHIGIVPAIFEEVMFRGYILRALEKSWGIIVAIIVTGLLFGAYHIQPSNFIPLSMLGILFAYITYVSRSLIPAMIAHLLNNGGQVIYGSMNKEFLEMQMTTTLEIPPLLIIGSTIFTATLIYLLFKLNQSDKKLAEHV
tara:strand:+ start:10157 stop:11143 length:987 start_codon:yes stop_codon:yes gene_type:complete